jgi:hypothetical protein
VTFEDLRNALEKKDFHAVPDFYDETALLDINVPGDRIQRRGRHMIDAFWRDDFGPRQFRFLRWEEHPAPWGVTVEASVVDDDPASAEYFRWVNLLFVEDRRIARHVVYCTGAWTTEAAEVWERQEG